MRHLVAFVSFLVTASAQAVTELIVPSSTPLPGCLNSREGTFNLNIVNATGFNTSTPTRRSWDVIPRRDVGSLVPRQQDGLLTLTLVGGVLTDQANRTGYIASNYQFQFDGPPQAGAIYTAGWGICSNGTLSLGGQAVFWQCLSGSFYNLYDRNFAEHCRPVYFATSGATGTAYSTSPPGPESTGPDQNTIENGGGTQTTSTTAAASTSATDSSASASETAETTSDTAASATDASSSATEAIASASSGASAARVDGPPQELFVWAAGLLGAVVLL